MNAALIPNRDEIQRTLRLIHSAGNVVELRALKTSQGTVSGYFQNSGLMADAAVSVSQPDTTPNTYHTLQQISIDLIARRANTYEAWVKDTTADHEVLSYRWFPLDQDPVRPSGISSTDGEKALAWETAGKVIAFLKDNGVECVVADSGNGYHQLVRIDLPLTEKDLVHQLLKAFAAVFNTPEVTIDTTVYNPSRIWKLYGTPARKGSNAPERPWRMSKLLDVPEGVEKRPITKDKLQELLAKLQSMMPKQAQATSTGSARANTGTITPEMVEGEAVRCKIELSKRILWKFNNDGAQVDGLKWQMECPFNPEHKSPDAWVGLFNNQFLFSCSHNSCTSNGTNAFRDKVDGFRFHEGKAAVAKATIDSWLPDDSTVTLTNEQVFDFIAVLSGADYETYRKRVMKKLGWSRPATLDQERDKRLPKSTDDDKKLNGRAIVIPTTDAWTEPVNLGVVLDEIESTLRRYIYFIRPDDAVTVSLWIASTWLVRHLQVAPYIHIYSPLHGCGKTSLLQIIEYLVYRCPSIYSKVSPAVVYRTLEMHEPLTMLVDELDSFVDGDPIINNVFNSGHNRKGAWVSVCVGDDNEPRNFPTFGFKCFGSIGQLSETLESRCLQVMLFQAGDHHKLDRFKPSWYPNQEPQLKLLARKIARWAQDYSGEVVQIHPHTLGIVNRNLDNWEPLLQVAEFAGGGWPEKARIAANVKKKAESKPRSRQFLEDIADIFHTRDAAFITSKTLVLDLNAQHESGWSQSGPRGTEMTVKDLGDMFRNFDVKSSRALVQGQYSRGYSAEVLKIAFQHFLVGYVPGETDLSNQSNGVIKNEATPQGGSDGQ